MSIVSQEVNEEKEPTLVLKSPDSRSELLSMLDRVIEDCYTKFKGRYCRNSEKLAWARVLGLLAKACNDLLQDVELEALEQRVVKIEELLKR